MTSSEAHDGLMRISFEELPRNAGDDDDVARAIVAGIDNGFEELPRNAGDDDFCCAANGQTLLR